MLQRVHFDHDHPLYNTAATRTLEAVGIAATGPHVLMQRAGAAIARLAVAIAPHARQIWVACGAGNNGGDGLEAAALLKNQGLNVCVSWLGSPQTAPQDTQRSWQKAIDGGVRFVDQVPDDLNEQDLCIDALLGIGLTAGDDARQPSQALLALLSVIRTTRATVLCVDLPSGLIADSGQLAPGFEHANASAATPGKRHTLSLLSLKPGLFTGAGRDEAGTVWLDDLDLSQGDLPPSSLLAGAPASQHRPHASHKGTWGDVAIVGGEGLRERGMGMTGAALLAATAALHAGAGRVMLAPLDADLLQLPGEQPEIMLRRFDMLELEKITVVCGCGGGNAVRNVLPDVLQRSQRLVLDADALNAIAAEAPLQALLKARSSHPLHITAMTPHPLEAAQLLDTNTATVQADRIAAAQKLAERFGCIVILKGSGSIIAAPHQTPCINPTGNARLATGGTGDVLAGLLGARIASMVTTHDHTELHANAFAETRKACWQHGLIADKWPEFSQLTASRLAQALTS
ncbi:NAD(P)H-hydrate dehydratase [Diaphorobacter sp. HDW4B]|uniref:NAD(P)H-hydrate dehydratase n=1 Tax=Diaphorobacter sp. HDW4B TaxID=2714925 RepID=UPI00140E0F63|nr:NAD(P)H-hydrate dehydratase [Diaphorobacter sp. HDW4B]QIL72506.1 NAD(P)H-hydrate dehydratase [Diaphorobacter sp. HDW4B]